MSLEKLQKIAIISMNGKYKGNWLMWWISTMMSRESQQFPPPDFQDVDLNAWLVKQSFWGSCNMNYFIHVNFKCLKPSCRRPFLKSLIAYCQSLVQLIGRMFSNLWTLWNVKDVSYRQRRCSHFLRGRLFTKFTMLWNCPGGESTMKRVIQKYVPCSNIVSNYI